LFSPSCREAHDARPRAKSLSDARDDARIFRVPEPEPESDKPTPSKSTCRANAPANNHVQIRSVSPPVFPPPASPPPLTPWNNTGALEYDAERQVFVERFPDPRAGAPINDKTVAPVDLKAYMANAGNLGDPDHFDTAELLMTTGLTNGGRSAHLKSRLVSSPVLIQEEVLTINVVPRSNSVGEQPEHDRRY
jgi:hypothetical protein